MSLINSVFNSKFKAFTLSEDEINFFNKCIKDLCKNTNFLSMDQFIQHGNTSCLWHSIAVAYYSYCFFKYFHINCDEKSLIYGALLHDYFLYDWHDKDKSHRFHGFTHGKKALINASKHYSLNKKEIDIIKNHMFPLTLVPPHHRESILVSLSDKVCSSLETFNYDMYKNIKVKVALH